VIELVEYDPTWPQQFDELRATYVRALDGVPWVAIEHVGSTSVEGLAAKPIIDVDIVVAAEHVDAATAALEQIGYSPLGELGIADRWAFHAPSAAPRTNTYVIVEGSLALRNHLGVRDVLRRDPARRDEYARVKRELAATVDDIEEYVEGKSAVLQRILERVGIDEAERAAVEASNRARPAEQR
jgi:GrpB-like predicted nucleotidyltransferase (UPF0157 family)